MLCIVGGETDISKRGKIWGSQKQTHTDMFYSLFLTKIPKQLNGGKIAFSTNDAGAIIQA